MILTADALLMMRHFCVKVGTSLGATKGLLLRGGSVLERFSTVNTVVFDKTGTLTIGRPTVTKVVSQGQGYQEDPDARLSANFKCIYTTSLMPLLGVSKCNPLSLEGTSDRHQYKVLIHKSIKMIV